MLTRFKVANFKSSVIYVFNETLLDSYIIKEKIINIIANIISQYKKIFPCFYHF